MKKIWNWFVLQSFKYGITRGGAFIGTKNEAFVQIRRLLGEEAALKEWENIQFDVKDIKFIPK